ncbi:MAG: NADH:ubiquinone reductase (Na(+)-transporting) subunit A, partial [Prevotella sp.]|nr:NADH:ubiquinone reductase (Na(+)-transporting) subunit A [Prevotella sp.]
MTKIVKLHRGLDIRLAGVAKKEKIAIKSGNVYALQPDDFEGVKPKVVVKEGDKVKAGDALFVNKAYPEVKFASPVSGTVTLIERGERRKVLSVQVEADAKQEYVDFGKKDVSKLSADDVKASLLEAGLFGYINQLPYAISTNPTTAPKAIFVSALRDMPLAGDFEFEVKGQEADFQTGLEALSKIAKVYVGVGKDSQLVPVNVNVPVEYVVFSGKCPAGNVGVQVNHLDPVNKGEVVWTVDPTAVLFFGRLFNTGKVNLTRTLALAGSEVENPAYFDALVGSQVSLNELVKADKTLRIIAGNPLTGKPQLSTLNSQ